MYAFISAALLAGHLCVHRQGYPLRFQLSISWSRRGTTRSCSGAAHSCGASPTGGHPCRGGRSSYWREPLCIARAWCSFSRRSFSPPWLSWCFYRWPPRLSTSSVASRNTQRLGGRHTHLSSSRAPSCSLCCAVGGPPGSLTCHRGRRSWPCPRKRPRSGSRGGGCPCRCRRADNGPHTASGAGCNRSPTLGAWRGPGCSSLQTLDDRALYNSYASG